MSTNYYVHYDKCESCDYQRERLHIGKSSAGWCFSLRIHTHLGIYNLTDWIIYWQGRTIVNEYGHTVTSRQVYNVIAEGKSKNGLKSPPTGNIIEPGDLTYDICDYEFS